MAKSRVAVTGAAALMLSLSAVGAAAQTANAGRDLAADCFTCHGTNGNSVGGVPPSLAGRSSAELLQIMKDFQTGKRPATIMHQHAKGYTDGDLALITAYLSTLKPETARVPSRPGSAAR